MFLFKSNNILTNSFLHVKADSYYFLLDFYGQHAQLLKQTMIIKWDHCNEQQVTAHIQIFIPSESGTSSRCIKLVE